ncbi:MAG: hypothetical protein ACTHOU_05610 [Aureliella sp.]|jgi:hypothetical protein
MTSPPPSSLPPVVNPSATGQRPSAKPAEQNSLLNNRSLLLGLLFGVTAALGLPLLWYSPAFSRQEKWWWSIAIVIYTLLLCAIACLAIWFAITALSRGPVV